MPLVDLDDPVELRARWSALAAIAHATGYDRRWWADAAGWHHEDGGGNDLRVVELEQERTVLYGLHREYSLTKDTDLLEGAPEWLGQPAVRERIAAGRLGFVFANFSGTWARAEYPGDPWQPIDDGFLAVGSWLTSDEEAAAELVEWAAEWADYLGSLDELRAVGLALIRTAAEAPIGADDLRALFDRLDLGRDADRQPDIEGALAAAGQFALAPAERVAPIAAPAEVEPSAEVDDDGEDFYESLYAPGAASAVEPAADPEATGEWTLDEATREFFPFAFDEDGKRLEEPVAQQTAAEEVVEEEVVEHVAEQRHDDVLGYDDALGYGGRIDPGNALSFSSPFLHRDSRDYSGFEDDPVIGSSSAAEYPGDPLGFRWDGPDDEDEDEPAQDVAEEVLEDDDVLDDEAFVFAPPPGFGSMVPIDRPPPPDDDDDDVFDLENLANLPPPGAADRVYSRFERENGLAPDFEETFGRQVAEFAAAQTAVQAEAEAAAQAEAEAEAAAQAEAEVAARAEAEAAARANAEAFEDERYAPRPQVAEAVVDDDAPVGVPAEFLEAAMRAEPERPRPRPASEDASDAFEALHAWCKARTKIVPSGFTIQVQVLDPQAPSYRFDLEPPHVDDDEFGDDKLAGLLVDLWASEATGEHGQDGWLFARIDAAGRTLRIDRWYDQIPDWWDDPVVARIDMRGLRRRLTGRGPDWRPTYLDQLSAR